MRSVDSCSYYQKKSIDYIPDVHIQWGSAESGEYFIKKVAHANENLFQLAYEHCATWDDHVHRLELALENKPFTGFYHYLSKKEILAQCFVGLTEENDLLFDCFIDEAKIKDKSEYALIYQGLELASHDILLRHPRLQRVLLYIRNDVSKDVLIHHYHQEAHRQVDSKDVRPIIGHLYFKDYYNQAMWVLASKEILNATLWSYCKKMDHSMLKEDKLPENDSLVWMHGLEMHFEKRKPTQSLMLNHLDRNLFFLKHPQSLKLFKKHPANPLVEEGFVRTSWDEMVPTLKQPPKASPSVFFPDMEDYDAWSKLSSRGTDRPKNKILYREHYGEYFITYEAMEQIIQKELIKKNGIDPHYNFDYCFVSDGDPKKLELKLKSIDLKPGENILIANILMDVHMEAVYIEKDAKIGQVKVYIADSQFPARLALELAGCIEAILTRFPSAKIIAQNINLQFDYYSCSTIALKSLKYFAKHGRTLFDLVDQQDKLSIRRPHFIANGQYSIYLLNEVDTPAPLLKLAQRNIVSKISVPEMKKQEGRYSKNLYLSDETLNEIVSEKKNLTLREYTDKYRKDIDGKLCQTAAIHAKYRQISKI